MLQFLKMEHPAQKRYHNLIHSLPCCFPTDETDEEEEIIEEYPQKETRRKKVRVRMEIQSPNTLYCLEYSLITPTWFGH